MIDIQKVIEFVENVYGENQTLVTQELLKMGLAENDILLSKTTRPLFFCATHQLENFVKQGYMAEEAAQELECRRTPRALDGDDCEHELDTSETGLFCIKCGECF